MMKRWEISNPIFDSDKVNPKLRLAYWEGHRDFSYDFISFIKPKRIVELGSQYGCSLFSFCQSIKDHQLSTEIHAVDMWSGNIGAEHSGEEVFNIVKTIKKQYFNMQDIFLYQMDFDTALSKFEDESIDILHIDGNHEYEAVKHDFDKWLPKLKRDGIILFHDVFSHIDEGSCIHWEETKRQYKHYFEFKHSCGLGVLFPKGEYWWEQLNNTTFFEGPKEIYYYRALYELKEIRFNELEEMAIERYIAIQEQESMIDERDKVIKAQEKMLEERYEAMQEQESMIDERDEAIKSQKKMLEERYEAIQEQESMIGERDKAIKAQEKMLEERYEAIQEQGNMIGERDKAVKAQKQMLEERYEAIQEQQSMINKRDETIKSQGEMLEERYEAIQEQESMINERDEVIKSQGKMLEERYEVIKEQESMINERDEVIKSQGKMLEERYEAIQKQESLVNNLEIKIEQEKETVESQARILEERYEAIEEQSRMIDERDTTIDIQRLTLKQMQKTIEEKQETIQYYENKRWFRKGKR